MNFACRFSRPVFGMALASALNYVIVKYVFDGYFYFQWQAALTLTFGILVFFSIGRQI